MDALDRATRVQGHGALDAVLQLAHIPLPAAGFQRPHGSRRERPAGLAELGVVVVEEMRRQRHDVAFALAQRRQGDRHHGDAVIQVFPEAARLDLGEQRPVGGADQAEIGLARLRAADAHIAVVLQHAQQAALQLGAHVGDLVEEEVAAMRLLEIAGAGLAGPGEGPLLVAEEQAFQQALRQSAAIDLEKRLVGTGAERMDQPGSELLAGAALALQQHGGVEAGDLADLAEHALHRGGLADEGIRLGRQPRLQPVDLAIGPVQFERLADDGLQRLQILEGLGQIIEQPFPHRRHGIAHLGEAGHENADQVGPERAELAQQVDAVGVGQALVHQHQIEILAGKQSARLGAIGSQADAGRLGEKPVEQDAGVAVVVDHQDFLRHVRPDRAH